MTTVLWETYCRAVAKTKIIPAAIKAYFIAQRILESLRGTTRQALELLNFGAMMRKEELDRLAHGWKTIDRYDYAWFWSIEEEIAYYWALVHRKQYYPDTDRHLADGRDFIEYIGSRYCPPGFPGSPAHEAWVLKTGFPTYTHYLDSLIPEAKAQLRKHGMTFPEDPVIVTPPPPVILTPGSNPYSVVNGYLLGPDVHHRLVSNHGLRPRAKTIGEVAHSTGCRAGKSWVKVDGINSPGILDGKEWNDPTIPDERKRSAHLVFCEDGQVWQAVDLLLPAYHAYGFNGTTVGYELVNIGPFYPWQAVFGWFFLFKGAPWEQRIHISEMRLVKGMYYAPFTEIQLARFVLVSAAVREYFKFQGLEWPRPRPHSGLPGNENRGDPGPLFPPQLLYL